jgi:hypothetical protein
MTHDPMAAPGASGAKTQRHCRLRRRAPLVRPVRGSALLGGQDWAAIVQCLYDQARNAQWSILDSPLQAELLGQQQPSPRQIDQLVPKLAI